MPRPAPASSTHSRGWGTLLDQWVKLCLRLSRTQADTYSGARKIIRPFRHTFEGFLYDDSLTLANAGYTKNKMRQLERHYFHPESHEIARQLWDRRCAQAKYGSVGFTCYSHFIKSDPNKKSKRASVMGPCIQSVTLTWLSKKEVSVDAFYRTTEIFKKFPADLVFIRDVLMRGFAWPQGADVSLTCHFANVTVHPMYFVTILGLIEDPIAELQAIKKKDPYFHDWIVKWTARYLIDEYGHGIQKFAQALRVQQHARSTVTSRAVIKYLRDNHPGYRRSSYTQELQGSDSDDDGDV